MTVVKERDIQNLPPGVFKFTTIALDDSSPVRYFIYLAGVKSRTKSGGFAAGASRIRQLHQPISRRFQTGATVASGPAHIKFIGSPRLVGIAFPR